MVCAMSSEFYNRRYAVGGLVRYETSDSAVAEVVEGYSVNVSAGFGSAVCAEMA